MNTKGLRNLFILIILLIVGWFTYRAINGVVKVVVSESEVRSDVIDTLAPSTLKISNPEQKKAVSKGAITGNKKLAEGEDENFDIFDRLEKAWLTKAQGIVGDEKYPLYLEMRARNEKEKMQAYKEYHDYLRQKYGDKFSYNISEDQSVREKQINERYLKDLLKLIGPLKFKEYTKARDQINEEMRKKNKEAIQIEF